MIAPGDRFIDAEAFVIMIDRVLDDPLPLERMTGQKLVGTQGLQGRKGRFPVANPVLF